MISEQIIQAKRILTELERLNSNPTLNGIDKIREKLLDLDAVVQHMLIKWDKL